MTTTVEITGPAALPLKVPILKILSGPSAFLIIYLTPIAGLPHAAHVVLATFSWAVVWWFVQPVPWGITALLPLVIFPFFGLMNVSSVASLYGQSVLFWLMGTSLLGWAMEKHGLAKRFALGLLNVKGIATTTHKVAFVYMLATGIISMFISDIATIAMTIPIGISIATYASSLGRAAEPRSDQGKSNFATFLALGSLYASVAGGIGTIAGTPPNAISVTLLKTLTGRTLGWFEWMMRGVPIFLALLITFYFLLRWFFPPEIRQIPGGEVFVREEARKLGRMKAGERNVLAAFIVMVTLFLAGPVASLLLGTTHPASRWLNKVLEIWIVPPIILFLLFLLPVDFKKREFTLTWKEAVDHVPWNIIFLTLGASAMLESLAKFGFLQFMETMLAGATVSLWTIPILSVFIGIITNFVSAIALTSLLGGVLIPSAVKMGLDPTSVTMMIPNLAIGILWPWAGPASATAFASGKIRAGDMFKVGVPATLAFSLIVGLIHLAFASFEQ